MTPAAFKSATRLITLDDKQLNDYELAIAFRCSWRMIRHYKEGTRPVNTDVADRLAYMIKSDLLPEVAKAIRERRANDKRRKS